METGVKIQESRITIDSVGPSLNDKKHQAQLRQVITKTYPSARAGNSASDTIFGHSEFGFTDGDSYDENRVTWIDVPIGTTSVQVQEKLSMFPNARLYKVMSLQPILTEEQERAMETGISSKTIEDYLQKYVVDSEGNPVLYNGLKQYRQIYFSKDGKADIDYRPSEYARLKAQSEAAQEFTLNEPVIARQTVS
jgi:hypothetical protein